MNTSETKKKYLSIEQCRIGGLYLLDSRNLAIGVFRKSPESLLTKSGFTHDFVGIRDKFGRRYLFSEFHGDCGEPWGTAYPIRLLEDCQIKNLHEEDNNLLFEWLEYAEKKYLAQKAA